MTYIRLARQILRGPSDPVALREALGFVAPGYPLTLAAVMGLFGVWAAYWVNLVFALLFVFVLWKLMVRLLESEADAAVATIATLAFLLLGYAINPHFILYPFRDFPAYVLLLAGTALFFAAVDRESSPRTGLVGAGLLWLASAAFREPAVLGVPGVVLAYLLHQRVKPGLKWRNVAWALAPCLLAAVLVVGLCGGKGSSQLQGWLNFIRGCRLDDIVARFNQYLPQMSSFVRDEMGWWGIALLVLALPCCVRRPRVAWTFVSFAVLSFVFYTFAEAHRRYFLACLIPLGVLAGVGAGQGADFVAWCIRRFRPADIRAALKGLVLLGFGAWLATGVFHLKPLGMRVRPREVNAFRADIARFAKPGDLIVCERRARHLADALLAYTDTRVGAAHDAMEDLAKGHRCFYLEPANEASVMKGGLMYAEWWVNESSHLHHRGDLIPVKGGDGVAQGAWLGKANYNVFQIRPFERSNVVQEVAAVPGEGLVLWLDFAGACGAGTCAVAVVTADGRSAGAWDVAMSEPLQALALPGSAVTGNRLVVRALADRPVPGNLVIGTCASEEFMTFMMGPDRRLSANRLVGANADDDSGTVGADLATATLRLPPVHGAAQVLAVLLRLRTANRQGARGALWFEANGAAITNSPLDVAAGREAWGGFEIPTRDIPRDRRIGVKRVSDPPDPHALGAASVRLAVRIGSDGVETKR
jgi:hypothetical protein